MSSRSSTSPVAVHPRSQSPWPAGPACRMLEDRGLPALALAWAAVVVVAVVGRLWQPEWNGVRLWNVTPLVAVALASGALFGNRFVAAAAPLVALAISNLFEPSYRSVVVAAAVYAASAWPVLLGGFVRRGGWLGVFGGAVASSLVFFVVTNFAHWAVMGDYTLDWAGLVECYRQALPFYRPIGDIVWSVAMFGGIAALTVVAGRFDAAFGGLPAHVRVPGAGASEAPQGRLD